MALTTSGSLLRTLSIYAAQGRYGSAALSLPNFVDLTGAFRYCLKRKFSIKERCQRGCPFMHEPAKERENGNTHTGRCARDLLVTLFSTRSTCSSTPVLLISGSLCTFRRRFCLFPLVSTGFCYFPVRFHWFPGGSHWFPGGFCWFLFGLGKQMCGSAVFHSPSL